MRCNSSAVGDGPSSYSSCDEGCVRCVCPKQARTPRASTRQRAFSRGQATCRSRILVCVRTANFCGERGYQVRLVTDVRAVLLHAERVSMLSSRGRAAPSRLVSSPTHVRRDSARTARAAVAGSRGAVSHRLIANAHTVGQRANSARGRRAVARCQSMDSMQSGVEPARVRS